jgi:hypothetical protein
MPLVDWGVATVGALAPLLANEMIKAARFSPAEEPQTSRRSPAAKTA